MINETVSNVRLLYILVDVELDTSVVKLVVTLN